MTQDTIEFNSVKTSHGIEIGQGPIGIRGQVGVDEFGGVINAVDIDWNGAKPGIGEGVTGINTTGELLSNIKEVYSPMIAN